MKSQIPLSVRSLEEVPNPSALVSLQFTHRSASDLSGLIAFKNVMELDLTGNCFEFGLPALHTLKFLRRLCLAENGIEEVWELPLNLEQLSLAGNRLKGLNLNLLSLSRLNTLDISRNQIATLKPLASLTHLKCLYASFNLISNTEGVDLLLNLVELDVSSNPIETEDELAALEVNQSLSVVILKDTPYYRHTKNIFDSYREGAFDLDHFEDGIFYRNLDRLKDLRSSRFKRKLSGLKILKADRDSPDWGSSKRSSCVQSACTSSRIDESFSREESRPPVARLGLPLLQTNSSLIEACDSKDQFTQLHRSKPTYSHLSPLSVEETTPWRSANLDLEHSKEQISALQFKIQTLEQQLRVQPDSQLEALFEDLVAYCLPEDHNMDLSFSPVKYSRAIEKVKTIVDECRELKAESQQLRCSRDHAVIEQERLGMRLADLESWRARHSCEARGGRRPPRPKDDMSLTLSKLEEAKMHLKALKLENEDLRAELSTSSNALIAKLRELEADNDRLRALAKESWRHTDSFQTESSMLDQSVVRRLPEEGKVLIDKQVGQYIMRLKDKISRLTEKLQKLRGQRNEYRTRVQDYLAVLLSSTEQLLP